MSAPKHTAGHDSDCAVHNEPAMPNGPCDCGYLGRLLATQVTALESVKDKLGVAPVETLTPAEIMRARGLRDDPDSEDNERFASWYGDALLAVHEDYVARVPGLERDLREALAARDHLRLTVKFQREEEARLKASKADLLGALLGCVPQLELGNGEAEHIKAARAAISKATGETGQ